MVVSGSGAIVQVGPAICRVAQAERGVRNCHLKVHSEMAEAAPATRAGLDIGLFGFQRGHGVTVGSLDQSGLPV